MTVSGTHDNEPWNFVECAMAKVPGGFTKITVYFFYKQCEACDGIDSVFQPFSDSSMVGNTTTSLGNNSDSDSRQEHNDGRISTTSTS